MTSPNFHLCPITLTSMSDPVLDHYGHSFERDAITRWLENNNTCPVGKEELQVQTLIPNRALKDAIEQHIRDHPEILTVEQLRSELENIRDAERLLLAKTSDLERSLTHAIEDGGPTKVLLERAHPRAKENQLAAELLMAGPEQWRRSLAKAIVASQENILLRFTESTPGPKCDVLSEVLKINQVIRIVDLHGPIGPEGAAALADALKSNQTIHTIKLSSNGVGPAGAAAIADALMINQHVNSVWLPDNDIGPEGARALADALKLNQCVHSLYLHSNNLGPDGALLLSDALKINTGVQTIVLSDNAIGDEGSQALCAALEENATLLTINLGRNSIGNAGFAALAVALSPNCTLKEIHLTGNHRIDDAFAKPLIEALRAKRDVRFHM